MKSALIVSHSEKGTAFFTEMLCADSFKTITALTTCGKARRQLLERDFDLVIINAPLRDESGEALARHVASKGAAEVILVVASEHLDEISAATEGYGVLLASRPVNRRIFWTTLKLAGAAQNRLKMMQAENSRLKQQIEDIRIIDRAKCVLISRLGISEQEAHRLIEKQAMDTRATRRAVAQELLNSYEG